MSGTAVTITLELASDPPIRATFALSLDVEQMASMDAAERMTASAVAAGPDGLALTLPVVGGRLRYLPAGWREWWASAGIAAGEGLPALATLRMFAARTKHRGEHGPPSAGAVLRRLLLSAALRRVADGASMRAAVADTTASHLPDRDERADAALLRRLTRHLQAGR